MSEASQAMLVTFWGTRGSISTPGRNTEKYGGNTPCVCLEYGSTVLIFDAGTGIRNLGIELARRQNAATDVHLFLSHTHWDHIQGLPFFEPSYRDDSNITIYGTSRTERFLENVLQGQMQTEYFPVQMADLAARLQVSELTDATLEIGGLRIDWEEQHCHPGGCVRYRVTAGEKRVVYATDVELDALFAATPETEDRRESAAAYLDFVASADLLIGDGQYTAEEYKAHVGWGHSSIQTLLDVAHRAQVKQLAVYHHDPEHSDQLLDGLWAECCASYSNANPPMTAFWAREGMTLAI